MQQTLHLSVNVHKFCCLLVSIFVPFIPSSLFTSSLISLFLSFLIISLSLFLPSFFILFSIFHHCLPQFLIMSSFYSSFCIFFGLSVFHWIIPQIFYWKSNSIIPHLRKEYSFLDIFQEAQYGSKLYEQNIFQNTFFIPGNIFTFRSWIKDILFVICNLTCVFTLCAIGPENISIKAGLYLIHIVADRLHRKRITNWRNWRRKYKRTNWTFQTWFMLLQVALI